ncbi:putative PTR2-Di-and tripeptide permease [Tilletiaria anomala UBC 951]|uniref:Putative PTR2-Di-and tripeptide permease n=1 Tax=Tilletiaria anomala (strain ATCC 24038 / CBS 436.72 / UBC 951) TaxID=1037660 RepID=A0A066VZL9_TILAU|nr:putative PTR2-Di-and tripeptide permease [Tilletiaria anomala UBC 951]KDN44259.1 putative PTR2-Di-and tripeptide permease [Tilletiaria anomala UBC 951]
MSDANADTVEYAAAGEAVIHNAQADGAKHPEAAIGRPLTVPSKIEGLHLSDNGLVYPTEDERRTLRRVPAALPWMAFWVAFCELAERFSYYGCTQVFQNYIQRPRPSYDYGGLTGANRSHEGNAGALGMGQKVATGLTTFNSFWVYCTPLLGAYLADAHWGRFKTICIAVAIASIGHIMLIINGIPHVMDNPDGALACFVISVIVMGFGTGFFKSNVAPLIAEQVAGQKQIVRVTNSGERVIVDPTLTISRLFMYFYLAINIGAVLGQVGMSFSAKYVGYWLAFTLPTVVFLLCIPVLYFGRNRYVRSPPSGSVLANALRLLRFAIRRRGWSFNPRADDFWTNVLPSSFAAEDRPKWMTFDDQWVMEVRRGFKACAVFGLYPLYWLCYNQINSASQSMMRNALRSSVLSLILLPLFCIMFFRADNLTSQAGVMVKNGVPNEITAQLDPLFIIVLVPFLDWIVYPLLRRFGFNFSPLKRICAGFFCASFAMVWAAVVQHYIYVKSPCGTDTSGNLPGTSIQCPPAPMSMWIQSGCYALIALSEIFTSITGLEYAFTKAPGNMKSLVMSLYLFQTALANALGFAFVELAGDPNLVINYGVFAGLAFVGGCLFWFFFHNLDKEEDALNNLDEGVYGKQDAVGNATAATNSFDEKYG